MKPTIFLWFVAVTAVAAYDTSHAESSSNTTSTSRALNRDATLIALGDWSVPVANDKYGLKIRGRLLMCEKPNYRGAGGLDAALYLELEECSHFRGGNAEVYCELAGNGLRLEMTDATGKKIPKSFMAFGGGVPDSRWVTIPTDASLRLRASVFGAGRLQDGGLSICCIPAGSWIIKSTDTNDYFLSGTFTATAPTDYKPADFRWVWQGTLQLPKMKVPKIDERAHEAKKTAKPSSE